MGTFTRITFSGEDGYPIPRGVVVIN